MTKYYYSPLKQKIIFSIWSGIALILSAPLPGKQIKLLKKIPKEFQNIEKRVLRRIIREFYNDRLVDFKEEENEGVRLVLTEQGVKRAISFKIDEMRIKKVGKWDKMWRIVIFDIPEKKKKAREALRKKLLDLGFYQMQKSTFIFPFECRDEIDFIVEFFELRSHVRYITATDITNESELKLHFNLS